MAGLVEDLSPHCQWNCACPISYAKAAKECDIGCIILLQQFKRSRLIFFRFATQHVMVYADSFVRIRNMTEILLSALNRPCGNGLLR